MTKQSLLSKAQSLFNRKDPMKNQPQLKAADSTTTEAKAAARKERQAVPELPIPEAVSALAISALAISNAADTILRKADAKFGLADWALLSALGAQAEAQSMGKLGMDLGVTRQRIQKQTDELQKSGLVTVSATEDDKRSRHVTLTSAGKEALAATASVWAAELVKSPHLGEMKSQAMVQRRVDRIATSLNRTLRADKKEAMAAKKAAKSATEAPKPAN